MSDPMDREVAVFSAARRLPAGERAAYLDQACAGDAALRQRVEELLQASEEAEGFLQDRAPGVTVLASSVTEKAGDKIGRYKLLQQIGEGGCGVVYMAEQEEPVRRRVALKVIKLGMDTKQVIARFEAERQALALMDHPNIAKVLDAGATETGRPYFVMELVKGVRITDYCDQNNLPTTERLALFTQVCHAIQHAHQKGIIHRDIKPSNILVTMHDGVPVPKVIDFGIAKATDQRLTDKTLFTAFEQLIGTPAYMSPEQAEMSGLDIDTRSDIYALGVLLYELLTGKTPFDARELLASGLDAMRRTIREQEPARPSTRLSTMLAADLTVTAKHRQCDSSKLTSSIRGDLDWIVMKALEKDRTRRYETANGLAADIRRHLNNEPVVARPPTSYYRLQKAIRRNKGAFAAAATISTMLVLSVVVSMWQAIRATRAEWEQTRQRQIAETKERKSEQTAQFLKDMLDGVGPSRALGRDTTMLREILDKTAERGSKDLTNQPEVEADLRSTIGRVYWQLAEYDKAEGMQRSALGIRRKLFGNEHTAVADSLQALGYVLWDRKDPRDMIEAEELYREALRIRTKLLGRDHTAIADSLTGIADVFLVTGKAAEAEPMYREALAMRRRCLGNEHELTALSVHNLADGLSTQGKLPEAETHYREALAIERRLQGTDSRYTIGSLHNLGGVLQAQGKLGEAESVYREALALQRKVFGPGHPVTVAKLQHLAEFLRQQEKIVEAESLARDFLAIIEKKLPDDWQTFSIRGTLGNSLLAQKKYTEAESLLLSAYEGMKQREDKIPAADKVFLRNALQRLVQLYEATGRPDHASEWKKKLAGSDKAER